MEEMITSADEERIFSESKKGINYAIFVAAGIVLLLAAYVIILVVLTMALLLIAAEYYFRPLQLIIFKADLSTTISWLVAYEWLIFLLTIAAYVYTLVYIQNIKKGKNERRFANKVLADKAIKPLEE